MFIGGWTIFYRVNLVGHLGLNIFRIFFLIFLIFKHFHEGAFSEIFSFEFWTELDFLPNEKKLDFFESSIDWFKVEDVPIGIIQVWYRCNITYPATPNEIILSDQ